MQLLQLTNWVKCFITRIVDSQKLMTPKQGHTIIIIVRTREMAIPQKVLNSRQTCYPNPLSVDPNICTCSPPLKVSSLKLLYHGQLPLDERHLKVWCDFKQRAVWPHLAGWAGLVPGHARGRVEEEAAHVHKGGVHPFVRTVATALNLWISSMWENLLWGRCKAKGCSKRCSIYQIFTIF